MFAERKQVYKKQKLVSASRICQASFTFRCRAVLWHSGWKLFIHFIGIDGIVLMMFLSLSSEKAGSTKGISCTLASCPRLLALRIRTLRILSGKASMPMPSCIWFGYFEKGWLHPLCITSRHPALPHGAVWPGRFFHLHPGCFRRCACASLRVDH